MGGHTYEDYRPSLIFPTRSAIMGLLGACLGIEREDIKALKALDQSFRFQMTVRANNRKIDRRKNAEDKFVLIQKITDFHTVKE